jgi:hypothetical protein
LGIVGCPIGTNDAIASEGVKSDVKEAADRAFAALGTGEAYLKYPTVAKFAKAMNPNYRPKQSRSSKKQPGSEHEAEYEVDD